MVQLLNPWLKYGAVGTNDLTWRGGPDVEIATRTTLNEQVAPTGGRGQFLVHLPMIAAALVLTACGGDGMTEPNGGGDVNLNVGEVTVREAGGEVLSLQLPSSSEPRTYRIAIQSASTAPGETPMRLVVRTGSASGSGTVVPSRNETLDPGVFENAWSRSGDLAGRMRIQESARRELLRRGARPARRETTAAPAPRFSSMLPSDSTPREGDTYQFWYPVQSDLNVSCDTADADTITAEVMAVGARAVMMEDTEVDRSLVGESMDYDSLAEAFDEEIFGTNVAYFGEPTDIDGNGRTYVLFTPKVNQLSDSDEEGQVTGFFLSSDLADSGDSDKSGTQADGICEASNEAEVVYLLAPDPDGEHGDPVEVSDAKRIASGTAAHEFQHLLNAGNRTIDQTGGFGDLEETWLDEGLSHVAEEVVGLGVTGDPIRSNLTFSDVVENQREADLFNTFHISNFARLAFYMKAPAADSVIARRDPGGLASLRMRGYWWIFLRWLADQEASASAAPVPVSGEENFFRVLAKADGGGLSQGVDNIESTTGSTWPDLLADFGLTLSADDTVPDLDERVTLRSWNLPVAYRQLRQATGGNGGDVSPFDEDYPLALTENTFTSDTIDFEVPGGTQEFLILRSQGSTPAVTLELSNQAGSALSTSSNARVIVARAR